MNKRVLACVLGCGVAAGAACSRVQAEARQVDAFQWEGVERVVAIGDLHGDYENYLATLRAAGLIDRKDKWSGGTTHLVQTGDIPDRGPDTIRIIEHLEQLAKQAKRKGGYVHGLIGNHEAMNVYGDLRYVSAGEYEAFTNRNSEALRDRYLELFLKNLEELQPEQFATLPPDFREEWYAEHPLGWVEHRQAWDPNWNAKAKYGNWVLERPVAIRVDDLLFVHGGISGFYCGNSLQWITDQVHEDLRNFDPAAPGILEDEWGPLWYRGLSGVEPVAVPESVQAVLEHHGAKHIVVGHTPTSGVIWPLYDGRVVMIDTGISKVYGGYVGYLERTPEGLFAGYPGGRLPLPQSPDAVVPYLEQVIAMDPDNPFLRKRLEKLTAPPVVEPESAAEDIVAEEVVNEAVANEETGAEVEEAEVAAAVVATQVPICGTAQ